MKLRSRSPGNGGHTQVLSDPIVPDPDQPGPMPDPGEPTPLPDPGEPTPLPDPGEPTPLPDPGEPSPAPGPGPMPNPEFTLSVSS